METTPKAKRRRGPKKKRLLSDTKYETENSRNPRNCASAANSNEEVTPPRKPPKRIIPKQDVEWQYHGRFNDADIVSWGSPQASPVVRPVRLIDASPVSSYKTSEGRKDQRKETCETPEFISELLALSEKIKATNSQNDAIKCEPEAVSVPVADQNNLNDSYSKLFDEDMNEFMMQCSQEVEEMLFKNATVEEKSNCNKNNDLINEVQPVKTQVSVLKKPTSVSVSKISKSEDIRKNEIVKKGPLKRILGTEEGLKERSHLVNNKSISTSKAGTNYFYRGRELGVSNKTSSVTSSSHETTWDKGRTLMTDNKNPGLKSNCVATKAEQSISFDAVKESFLEEDLDILSAVPEEPDIEPDSSVKSLHPNKQPFLHKQPLACDNIMNSGLDDSTFFKDDILQILDSLESNVTCSQTTRCTPEEIEKKRKEAKSKLEKKKRK